MKPSEVIMMLKAYIPARLPALLVGKPGIGKTDVCFQAAQLCDADIVLSHPVVEDPTDVKGLPAKLNDTEATFLPYGQMVRIMKATKLTLWFLDDLGQATPAVQASYMQPILAREINGRRIPDCVTFVAATNRRSDKAGVSGVLEPVKSRFVSIIELTTDLQEWCNWAIKHGGISATLIAFMRLKPDRLSAFNPTADMTNSPSPRTWANLAKIEALGLPATIEHEAMSGSVGEGDATDYLTFRKMCAHMVSADAILTDPANAALPKTPGERYAISTALAARANEKTIARIGHYVTRMAQADMGEFAALCVRDSLRRVPGIANTADYVKLMCGPVGQLISGQTITT